MAFFKRQEFGRLYAIKLTFSEGLVVYKVGMTDSDRAVNRMMEILRSWFMVYRFIPHTELKLNREVKNPKGVEKAAHAVLRDFQWVPNKKVDGGTEMFTDLDEIKMLHFLKHVEPVEDCSNLNIIGNELLKI